MFLEGPKKGPKTAFFMILRPGWQFWTLLKSITSMKQKYDLINKKVMTQKQSRRRCEARKTQFFGTQKEDPKKGPNPQDRCESELTPLTNFLEFGNTDCGLFREQHHSLEETPRVSRRDARGYERTAEPQWSGRIVDRPTLMKNVDEDRTKWGSQSRVLKIRTRILRTKFFHDLMCEMLWQQVVCDRSLIDRDRFVVMQPWDQKIFLIMCDTCGWSM